MSEERGGFGRGRGRGRGDRGRGRGRGRGRYVPPSQNLFDESPKELRSNINDQEIISSYSKLAKQQCNFNTPLSTLITSKAGDSCSFRVRIGIERLGVDVVETDEGNDNDSTVMFVEGTRNLIVWNMDNEKEGFKCFYDMMMNTTTITSANIHEELQTVVERGDDVMIFLPTDVLSNGVENVVSAPGLYQMMDGSVGWSTASGVSNVTMIDGMFIDLCEELLGNDGGASSASAGAAKGGDQNIDHPPFSPSGGDPSVSVSSAEPPSSGFAIVNAPWQGTMSLMALFVFRFFAMR